jgi:hypothetical protein
MLEFPINVYQEPWGEKPYAPSFNSPVLLFMTDKADRRSVFPAFALCDFRRGQITYITSYTPENAARLEQEAGPSLERHFEPLKRSGFRQGHSVIEVVPGESFLAFVYASQPCGFFYHVDYRRKVLRLITAEDFERMSGTGPVDSFGSTFTTDPEDPRRFYMNAKLSPAGGAAAPSIAYYRVALDLGQAEHLLSRPCEPDDPCPHATRRSGDRLFSSEFSQMGYVLEGSGRHFRTDASFYNYVIQDYWSWLGRGARLRAIGGRIAAHPLAFLRSVRRARRRVRPRPRLRDIVIGHCFRSGHPSRDFLWACQNSRDYRFRVAPGCIRVLSLTEKAETACAVRHGSPAHFEIGRAGHVYLSCHNFLMWNGKRYMVEPASILKLKASGGGVEEMGVFQHPTGFRYSSHVVLETGGRERVCTIAHPNRLMVIDGESMKLVAMKDIGRDWLSSRTDLPYFLSTANLEREATPSLAASEDGRYLALAGRDAILVVDVATLDVVDTVPVSASVCRLAGRQAGQISSDAPHCQRLR